ncbi:MAG TPA: metal-binding protein [Clostridiaceae bacterium]|nr:metal-binding protein [Clostridiaceae bacterium]
MSYRFFQNRACEFFPCHHISEHSQEAFNCLFCYCPLYPFPDCGGRYWMLQNGLKDCSNCTLPHYEYDLIVNKLIEKYPGASSAKTESMT